VRPEYVLRRSPIEIPVALGAVGVLQLHGFETVFDLGRQQITVLIADVGRRAFKVNVDPAARAKR